MNSDKALQNIHGTIILAGAGKMGGAMLSGWLAEGLDVGRAAVIEPHPSEDIRAHVARGVRLNPSPQDRRIRRSLRGGAKAAGLP